MKLDMRRIMVNLPPPQIDEVEGFLVVRDDLLEGGTKTRIIGDYLEKHPHIEEWVYPSPRQGYAQLAISIVCNSLGLQSTIFVPKGEKSWISERTEYYGGNVVLVPMGYLSHLNKRAREYADESEKRKLIPFGCDDEIMLKGIEKVAKSLPIEPPQEIWSSLNSGVLSRGLQTAFPKSKVYGVQTGHNPTEREKGRAIIIKSPYQFSQVCKKNDLDTHHRSLKVLFQRWSVPPWQRAHTPLLFYNDQLAAIIPHAVIKNFSQPQHQEGIWIKHKLLDHKVLRHSPVE